MYRNFGIVAPRSNHALVYINGEFNGVFANTENIDGPFTNKHFTIPDGNLYKEVWPVNSKGDSRPTDYFVNGLKILLSDNGILIIQFSAYLLELIKSNEFDMIYHEHFSYFSFSTLEKIFAKFKLKIFDVEELSIHGGSLRLYITHENNNLHKTTVSVENLLEKEKQFGLLEISTYEDFPEKIKTIKQNIYDFFISAKKENKKIICYGAPAKGNTLLNYCGIGKEFMPALDEGSYLLMPTTMSHSGIEENIDVIQKVDGYVAQIPEVQSS